MWFFDFFYNFEYVIYNSPYLCIYFMPFLGNLLLTFEWKGLRDMVEGEVALDRGNLGKLAHQSFHWDLFDIKIEFISIGSLTARNPCGFNVKFCDVLR